jgi:hypothetical protein
MRKKSGGAWTFFAGVFVLTTALFHAGCEGFGSAEGEFENQTSYSITVTIVGSSFGIWSESSQSFTSSESKSFTIASKGKARIQSGDSTINFRWTTSSSSGNSKIYVVNNGDKVIFKE